jgi:recombination protein RecR
MEYPSKLIEDAVNEFARLPGVGRKTAMRLVLHLLKQKPQEVKHFGDTITKMREQIRFCRKCHNVADADLCNICSNGHRDHDVVCVVESIRDIIAIENTNQYRGTYHVLGGVINPVEGVGPEALNLESLYRRIKEDDVSELIMALPPNMEGDTTIFYISKQLKDQPCKISTIARGISFGGELEYTDEHTLARSIATRLPYENYLINR